MDVSGCKDSIFLPKEAPEESRDDRPQRAEGERRSGDGFRFDWSLGCGR